MKVLELGRGGTAVRVLAVALLLTIVALAMSVGSPRAAGLFEPTITFETSTTRATSHPDARITVNVPAGNEDLKTMTLTLPTGFWGSLAAATKCSYQDAQTDSCAPASQIGTVMTEGTIDDSEALLRGKVYLTKACGEVVSDPAGCSGNKDSDPAGITIVVPAKVGGVDLGDVTVNARVQANYTTGVTLPTGAVGSPKGIKTIVPCSSPTNAIKDCIPNSITDTHGRTVTFHASKFVVDLISKTTGPPLLTNPSRCATTPVTAVLGSWDGSSASPTSNYTVTGCDTVAFKPGTFSFSEYTNTAGNTTGLRSQISFPTDSATMNSVTVAFPRGLSLYAPGYGTDLQMCPASSVAFDAPFVSGQPRFRVFSDVGCPTESRVGTATINTPLLDTPITARIYLIGGGTYPDVGLIARGGVDGNPAGVTISLFGQADVPQVDSACDNESAFACWAGLRVTFSTIPDAPVSSIDLKVGEPAAADLDRGVLGNNILQTVAHNSPECQQYSDFTGTFISSSGSTVKNAAVDPFTLNGCDARDTTVAGGVDDVPGHRTTDATPSFEWTSSLPETTCTVDSAALAEVCASPWEAPTLTNGLHRFYVGAAGSPTETRAFVVDSGTPADTTAPATPNITSGPTSGSTSDTTPTWNFTDAESTSFQCSIDSGAFLPCGSGSTSGTFTQPEDSAFWAGSNHTFAVRAMDAAGNLSSNATGSFSVDIDFNPTSFSEVSTSGARQHPNFDLTITNDSHEDIKDLSFKLPDGLFGGLTGVKSLCPITTAQNGDCTSDSQVGTVDTEALVDETVVRVSGQVYLTEHDPSNNDPAGISIKIPAVIQSVNLGDVIVPARLKVREHARGRIDGIDTLAINLPKEIEPDDTINPWDTTTEIDLKKMELHLRNNPAASQPLLTNPSDCSASAFVSGFTGYDASTVNMSQAWNATGCDQLGFNPGIQVSLIDPSTGKVPAASTPAHLVAGRFTTTLTSSPGDANIDNASVLMPLPVTISVSQLGPTCSIAAFDTDTCPANTIYGSVSAITPLLAAPLTGDVYLIKQATALPAIYLRLRGPIGVDVVGRTSFENVSQIRTKFDDLPDAPLTSLSLQIDNVISTRPNACEFKPEQWNMTGTFNSNPTNGKSSSFALPMDFTCPPARYKVKFKARGKKTTLSADAIAQGRGGKIKKLLVQLPKGVKINKKALAKKVTLRGDGKKLKSKCFKAIKKNTVLEIKLCNKRYEKVSVKFASGSLTAPKKVKKPKVKMTVYNASGQKASETIDYFG